MSVLLITIVPSILILSYFFLSDRFKEPKGSIALVFFLGVLICLPAGIINDFMYENYNDGSDFSKNLYNSGNLEAALLDTKMSIFTLSLSINL